MFTQNDTAIYSQESTIASEVDYNSFFDNNLIGNILPNSVGVITTTNFNNTPSDFFYNIFVDPEILSYDYLSSNFCVPSDSSPLIN